VVKISPYVAVEKGHQCELLALQVGGEKQKGGEVVEKV
jgi:hypothetical protein